MSVIKVIATNFNCLQEVWPAVKIKKKKKNSHVKEKLKWTRGGIYLISVCILHINNSPWVMKRVSFKETVVSNYF